MRVEFGKASRGRYEDYAQAYPDELPGKTIEAVAYARASLARTGFYVEVPDGEGVSAPLMIFLFTDGTQHTVHLDYADDANDAAARPHLWPLIALPPGDGVYVRPDPEEVAGG